MNVLWLALGLSTFFAFGVKPRKEWLMFSKNPIYSRISSHERILVFLVFLILALIAGLRSGHNDTYTYLYNFSNLIPNSFYQLSLQDWSIGANPGFYLYQVFIKQFITTNQYGFILVSSVIVLFLFVKSYYRYSTLFYLSIFLFITSGLFVFSMAAMKQIFSMAIGFWAVKFVFEKSIFKFVLAILLASTIHPYILLYLIVPFFKEDIWSKKIILSLIFCVLIGFMFERFVSIAIEINSSIGNDSYELEYITKKAGMNILRVAIFAVTPVLSFFYRKKIIRYNNSLLNVSINMSIISLMFMIMGISGGANLFGRMGNYFEPFTYIALPWIINFISSKKRFMVVFSILLFYTVYFYYQFAVIKQFEYNSWL